MENQSASEFGPFLIDVRERVLLRHGEPVPLTPKAFDVLAAFVEQPGRLFTKAELLQRVWPDTYVEESNLAYNVFAVRKALGDTADAARYIETVPKRGYRFKAAVTRVNGAGDGQAALAALLNTNGHNPPVEPSAPAAPRRRPSSVAPPSRRQRHVPRPVHASPGSAGRLVRMADLALGLTGIGYGAMAWWRASRETESTRAVPLTSLTGAVRAPWVSPDGAFVAFTWSGDKRDNPDVYVQQIGVGSPLRVTTHRGNDYGPTWSARWTHHCVSPAGSQADSRVTCDWWLRWAVSSASSPTLNSGSPTCYRCSLTWCPDSTCVVVTDSPGDQQWDALFAISLDTGEKRQLTRPERAVDVDPAVSPSGP